MLIWPYHPALPTVSQNNIYVTIQPPSYSPSSHQSAREKRFYSGVPVSEAHMFSSNLERGPFRGTSNRFWGCLRGKHCWKRQAVPEQTTLCCDDFRSVGYHATWASHPPCSLIKCITKGIGCVIGCLLTWFELRSQVCGEKSVLYFNRNHIVCVIDCVKWKGDSVACSEWKASFDGTMDTHCGCVQSCRLHILRIGFGFLLTSQ